MHTAPFRLAMLALASVGACSLVSNFDGLDDAPAGAVTGSGGAGAASASSSSGQAGGGAAPAGGEGGAGAGGDGGAGGGGGEGGEPACKEAVEACSDPSECCAPLLCANTVTHGVVCCGGLGAPCTGEQDSADCCGSSDCVDGFCD